MKIKKNTKKLSNLRNKTETIEKLLKNIKKFRIEKYYRKRKKKKKEILKKIFYLKKLKKEHSAV